MIPKLNSCGYCGNDSPHIHQYMSDNKAYGLFMAQVRCASCSAQSGVRYGDNPDLERQVARAWNLANTPTKTLMELFANINQNVFVLMMLTYIVADIYGANILAQGVLFCLAGSFILGVAMALVIGWRSRPKARDHLHARHGDASRDKV